MTLKSLSLSLLLFVGGTATVQAIDSLHDALPANTVAYLRLAGNGDFIGPAPGTTLHQAMTRGDLAGLSRNLSATLLAQLAKDPDLEKAAPWMGLLSRLRAPVEAVALLPAGLPAPMANVLLRAGVEVESVAGLNALIGEWVAETPFVELTVPLAEDGVGRLTYKGEIPLLYSYDAQLRVVYVMSGVMADEPAFQDALASLQASQDHPMYAIEARVDSSGLGPFLWVDGASLMAGAMGGGAGMPGMMPLVPPGIVNSLAMGWGVRDGKGRLAVIVDVPRGGMGAMLPQVANRIDLSSRGEPWIYGNFNIPVRQLLLTFEGFLQMNPEAMADYQINKTIFADTFGLNFEQLASVLGPELLFFGDKVGEFAAVRVADPEALETLMQGLEKVDALDYGHTEVDGVRYHYLAFDPLAASLADVGASTMPLEAGVEAETEGEAEKDYFAAALERLNSNSKSHLYWVQEGDFLVFAQLPQMLMDRVAAQDPVVLADWLRERQGQNPEHALMLFSVRMDDIPRRAYYAWLQSLAWVGDVVGQPMDIFAQAPASQLDLPDSGSYGLQVDIGDPYLSVELSFDFTPGDFLLGKTGAFSAAVLAAAVAIAVKGDDVMEADAEAKAEEGVEVEVEAVEKNHL